MAGKKTNASAKPDIEKKISRAHEIIRTGTSRKAITRDLKREFGSLAMPARITIAISDMPDKDREADAFSARTEEEIFRVSMERVIAALMNFGRWKRLAEEDREGYRRELDMLVRAIRIILNCQCGVGPHRRQENEARDDQIVRLMLANPKLSPGQVAIQYNKRRPAGAQVTRNQIGLIYERHCRASHRPADRHVAARLRA